MLRNRDWIAPTVAMAAFLAAILAFVLVLCRYLGSVREWSQGELDSRARLTAFALAEPLKTLDFRAVESAAARLGKEGLRLRIVTGAEFRPPVASSTGGGFFDSASPLPSKADAFQWGSAPAGEFFIGVGRPSSQTLRPFYNALSISALAALTGICAMGFVFFALYRQRVRIQNLKRAEKFRRDFVADVSHEIRTPLTGILGAVDMLCDEAGEAKASLLKMLKDSAQRLSALVQQILDLSRMERSGEELQPNMRECDLSALAREVARTYAVEFRGKGQGEEPCVIRCDEQMIAQALSNLVENAKRHSRSNEIFVECSASGANVVLAVEDRGIGIPAGHEERVFERFYRVDPSRAAETGGAGLGLAIVRSAARLHGGDVAYKRAKPCGSRFEIALPRRA